MVRSRVLLSARSLQRSASAAGCGPPAAAGYPYGIRSYYCGEWSVWPGIVCRCWSTRRMYPPPADPQVCAERDASPPEPTGHARRAISPLNPPRGQGMRRERKANGQRYPMAEKASPGQCFRTPLCRRKITMRASARLLFAIALLVEWIKSPLQGRGPHSRTFWARL